MTLIIGGHCPRPVKIRSRSPQGSVLGCLLYCITTQTLTAKICRPMEAGDDRGLVVYFPQDDENNRDVIFWEVEASRDVLPYEVISGSGQRQTNPPQHDL